MWFGVFILLVTGVLSATPTQTRISSHAPIMLYDFLDADITADYLTSQTSERAGHATVQLGNLSINAARALWLKGKPGLSIAREMGSNASAGMTSVNTWGGSAWASTISSGFTAELWVSANPRAFGEFVTIGGAGSLVGTQDPPSPPCTAPEPFLLMGEGASNFQFRYNSTNGAGTACSNQFHIPPSAGLLSFGPPAALYWSVDVSGCTSTLTVYQNGVSTMDDERPLFARPLRFDDMSARLRVLYQNASETLSSNVHMFAIYPGVLNATQKLALYHLGLPNAHPFALSFNRAVQKNVGGLIRFCRNVIGTPLDSDCLDYENDWSASHDVFSLTAGPRIAVYITSLPAKGTLRDGATTLSLSNLPYRTANNTITYIPATDDCSWFVGSWTSLNKFAWSKRNSTSFTYLIQDLGGLNSTDGTVTLEVFPGHNKPLAADMFPADTQIYAGLPIRTNSLGNAIVLKVTRTEYIKPTADLDRCDATTGGSLLCFNGYDQPPWSRSYVTITSIPAVGKLWYAQAGVFYEVAPGQQILVDTLSVPPCGGFGCVPSYIVYYNVSLDDPAFVDKSTVDIGSFSFTYFFTTTWNDPGIWNSSTLGNTLNGIDTSATPSAPAPVAPLYATSVASDSASVSCTIKNGFFSQSSVAQVKQRKVAVGDLPLRQPIQLQVQDLTVTNPLVTVQLNSLPAKGKLFLNSSVTTPIVATTFPYSIGVLANTTIYYAPSMPGDPDSLALAFGPNYDNFSFFAFSGTARSANATVTVSVQNTNDPVTIETPETTTFTRNGNPGSWSELASNDFRIDFTDPDPPQANEPLYRVRLSAGPDFTIFLSDDAYVAIGVNSSGGQQFGMILGANAAGAGAFDWTFIVPRDVAVLALNSVRLRPNSKGSQDFVIEIEDCFFLQGVTQPDFQGPDWTPVKVSKTVTLTGQLQEKAPSPVGTADPAILGVVYGLASFVGLTVLIAVFCCGRWLLRRKERGERVGSRSASARAGSGESGSGSPKASYSHHAEL